MLRKRIIFTLIYENHFFNQSRNFRLQKVGNLNWLEKNYKFKDIAFALDELIILNASIKNKNIKNFYGKPLIYNSIKTAIDSKLFDDVIVSSDSEKIQNIAKKYGAEVPFVRPKSLSDDFTTTGDVVKHAIDSLKDTGEEFNYACTIYATAPLLQEKYLKEGLDKLKNSNAYMAFSATSMPFPIQRTFKLDKNGRCEMFTPEHYMSRSQDLEEAYQDAGQFYWTKLDRESKEIMFGKDSIPIILPRDLVQDIDTLEDWERAEKLYALIKR